ncbi:ABC transporter G family member 23-like [Brevipalpus obovatus]|uniref:ABC transporter G family member 23-like n=1 Tax=Brevipalpus obovatus TaxID=246614 RepID=UPI003D9F2C46
MEYNDFEGSEKEIILQVEDISFSYDSVSRKSVILQNVNLAAYASEICAIVGPSGCGKTTLIKLAISLLPLSVGSIKLFGLDAGDPLIGIPGPNVGYMPQEDALPSDLRVRDSLYFFGLLNNMSIGDIRKRIDEVLEQVDLVESSQQFIFQLSGGMKRRLSLAISLLHSPQLLILDEPTVGCDPLLRTRIWKVLKDMSRQNGTCILITTHYYEECREADSVNFIREKNFVLQASPKQVLSTTGAENLDEAFFRICIDDNVYGLFNQPEQISVDENFSTSETSSNRTINNLSSKQLNHFKITLILILRYVHAFVFDFNNFQIVISTPTIVLIMAHICTTFRIVEAPVGIVIENQTLFHDQSLLNELNIDPKCYECLHPRHFIDHMNKDVFQAISYEDLSTAMEDLRAVKLSGVVHIGDQFSDYYIYRVATHWAELPEEAVRNTRITFYGDASKEVVFKTLQTYLLDAYTKFWKASKANLGLKNTSLYPFEYGDPVSGPEKDEASDKSYYTDVGQLLLGIILPSITLSSFSMLREMRDQTMKRCLSTGVEAHHLFIAQLVTNFVFLGLSSIGGMFTIIYLLDLPLRVSLFSAIILILGQNLIGIVMGQMIAVILMSEVATLILSLSSSYFLCGVSGFVITLETQPYYLQTFQNLSPFTIPAMGIRNALLKGLTLTNIVLMEGLLISIVYFILFSYITLSTLRKRIT